MFFCVTLMILYRFMESQAGMNTIVLFVYCKLQYMQWSQSLFSHQGFSLRILYI